MITTRPVYSAHCDRCMRSAGVSNGTVIELLRNLDVLGWEFDREKELCQDCMLCPECRKEMSE